MSPRTRGAVACPVVLAALLAVLLAGCSGGDGPVDTGAATPSGADAEACTALLDAVPDTLAGLPRREASPAAAAAAWGEDPAVVLTCGVDRPEGFDRFSRCLEADGVGWFVPPDQERDQDADVLLTAVGFRPRVALLVPAERRGPSAAAALSELAEPVTDALRLAQPCR